MGNQNRLVRNIVIGAVAGAVVSFFHKPTRDAIINETKYVSNKMNEYLKEPSKLTTEIKTKVEDVKDTIEQAKEDALFINGKLKELKETTPQVIEILSETKERFSK